MLGRQSLVGLDAGLSAAVRLGLRVLLRCILAEVVLLANGGDDFFPFAGSGGCARAVDDDTLLVLDRW